MEPKKESYSFSKHGAFTVYQAGYVSVSYTNFELDYLESQLLIGLTDSLLKIIIESVETLFRKLQL